MPEEATVDNFEGATTSDTDDNAVLSDPSTEGNGNESEGDIKPDTKLTLTDAIEASLNEQGLEEEEGSPASEDQDNETEDEASGEDQNGEDSRLDKNPRFQELIGQKRALEEELKVYEPYRKFAETSTLNDEEKMNTLNFGEAINRALLGKDDPKRVLQELSPIVTALQNAAGLVIPADIQEAIDKGEISEEYAQRLVSANAEKEAIRNQNEYDKKKAEENQMAQTRQQAAEVKEQVLDSVNKWEVNQMAQDPDYEQKKPMLDSLIKAELTARNAKGEFITPNVAIEISNNALAQVNGMLGGTLTKPKSRGSLPSGAARGSKVKTKPKSIEDAIGSAFGD